MSIGRKHVQDMISSLGTGDHAVLTAGNADFALSSLRHMNFYELKFGPVLGRAAHMDLADPRMKNQAWILSDRHPGHSGMSSWEIRITLDPMVMEYLLES